MVSRLNNDCCPETQSGVVTMLGCCDFTNAIIDGTHRTLDSVFDKSYSFHNATRDAIVQQSTKWRDNAYSCANPPNNPAVDKVGFCNAFKRTFDFVWDQFTTHQTSVKNPQDDCLTNQSKMTPAEYDQCIVSAIIGYTIITDFDANACKGKCPGPNCPKTCTDEDQRNQSVQALLRGVPWTSYGDATVCAQCPNLDPMKCPPIACVATLPPAATAAPQYHGDGFLHFWPGYNSEFNLNPFARFIHNPTDGLAAMGAYSFSIDDFYGNFAGPGSKLIVNLGGTSALENKEPHNPYKQYFVTGIGWDHARVCGRVFKNSQIGLPISFWKDQGNRKGDFCQIVYYKDAAETEFVVFLLQEQSFQVTDSYQAGPANVFTVQGLSGASSFGMGTFAVRPGETAPIPNDAYCAANSTAALVAAGKCKASLTPHGNNLAYVGVKECLPSNAAPVDPSRPYNATCGRPLMNLSIPALP